MITAKEGGAYMRGINLPGTICLFDGEVFHLLEYSQEE
jgi:hypothetical protein